MFNFEDAYEILNNDFICTSLLNRVHPNNREDVKQECSISILRTIKLYEKNKKELDKSFVLRKFVRHILNRSVIDYIRSQNRKINKATKYYDLNNTENSIEKGSGDEAREFSITSSLSFLEYGFDVAELRIDFQLAKKQLSKQHYEIGKFLIQTPFGFDFHYQDVAEKLQLNVSAITYAKRKLKALLA